MAQGFQRQLADPDARVVVALSSAGTLIAMGTLQVWRQPAFWLNPERQGRVSGVIDDVWVEPRHRRRGLSQQIVALLVEFAERRGVTDLMLEYATSNPEAAATWTRRGPV